MMAQHDKELWRSIGHARYDFGAVGAALFSFFGLIASGVASGHVVAMLFAPTTAEGATAWDAVAYGIALFLLAEGVAYYIEVYSLFEGRLRWWLWGLRYIGPLLSACAGYLAAYAWLPEAYKMFAIVTTIVLPLFQWGFLSVLMDRIRAIHARRMDIATPEPTPDQQLVTMYRDLQQLRAFGDLERMREMMEADRRQPLMLARVAVQPDYPTPVAVEATPPVATEATPVEQPVARSYACPSCGQSRSPQAHALAFRYDKDRGWCKACKDRQKEGE